MMGAAWVFNLCVAEWLIGRRRRQKMVPVPVAA